MTKNLLNKRFNSSKIKVCFSSLLASSVIALVSLPTQGQVLNSTFSATPPESSRDDPPIVMMSLSRDHQYFFRAYNDYTDLDPEDLTDVDENGNPNIETTYKHSFSYFGYFDSTKCYAYDSTPGVYRPDSFADTNTNYCSLAGQDNLWSGNFLNWLSTTRMDIVRRIFFGGLRSTDTPSETILERAYLPSDAHSFAKYYNGDDIDLLTPFNPRHDGEPGDSRPGFDNIDEGITFCNTTYEPSATSSQNVTRPPQIRAVEGNWQLWASNERWQCTWDEERSAQGNSNNPVLSFIDAEIEHPNQVDEGGLEFTARVQACVPDLIGTENCKTYPDGTVKPIGILQIYGDDGLINFGLMTGSFDNNTEGGVLRKNAGPLADEVDVTGTGEFIFTNQSDSIIKFLSFIRPWGYNTDEGTYTGGSGLDTDEFDDCTFQLIDIPDNQCRSWGNPISEVFAETIRYLAGLEPNEAFEADDTTFITGLNSPEWEDPIQENVNECSDLNTILINASVSSFDNDSNDLSDVPGGLNGNTISPTGSITNEWTNRVGEQENINGNDFFIGVGSDVQDEICTSKRINQLSDALGLCPEAPTVSGSFSMAGIAYYAHNNDIRDDLDGNQTVNTFAISLATNVPVITVPRMDDDAQEVQILPAYRLQRNNGEGGGALVDFRIVQPHTRIDPNDDKFEAVYYVNWEDSEQGGDYDQDLWGTIRYLLDESDNTLTITTDVIAESTNQDQLFGFVTNGTTQDGFHAYSGIEGANFGEVVPNSDPVRRVDSTGVVSCNNCRPGDPAESHTFSIASTAAATLESPLFYAAKYGGFTETLENDEELTVTDEPDEIGEWDAINNTTGLSGADGLPDNFFFVTNPETLFSSIESALDRILSEDRSSSSAVANFAGSNGFENIIIQGTYQELIRDSDLNEAIWTGEIFSFFIDSFGFFREDNQVLGTQGELDSYSIDRAFRYDTSGEAPSIQFIDVQVDPQTNTPVLDATGFPVTTDSLNVGIDELDTLWSGGERLRNLNNDSVRTQRIYSSQIPSSITSDENSRYIFTYIDEDLDGVVDAGEQRAFDSALINSTTTPFFGVTEEAEATSIVDFIRGYEDPNSNFRNRTLTINDNDVVFRLGDIVNSTPLVVAGPSENYDTEFGDQSYAAFREQYSDRRQVAYVGANDGLLHAFNAGFRDVSSTDVVFETSPGTQTDHPLGSELWAYAPFNLLPHLQFLASADYSHVFYVDGDPQAYDVKIFNDDATHPEGWGTILVVNMRQGGGDFPVTTEDGTEHIARSAYIILDITDPEQPPTVLAEVTDPDLNLTLSEPDLFYDCGNFCDDNNPNNNFNGSWQLLFGSGPNNVRTLTTFETAKIFAYDLESGTLEQHTVTEGGNSVQDSFVSSVIVRDWDNGALGFRNDDVAYFGTIGLDGNGDETGAVYRYFPDNTDETNLLIDVDRPVLQPVIALNRETLGNDILASWVYIGTGIFITRENGSTSEIESILGVIEPVNSFQLEQLDDQPFNPDFESSSLLTYATVNIADLVNVTDIDVINNDNGALGDDVNTGDFTAPVDDANSAENFGELSNFIVNESSGWIRNLPSGTIATDPSARITDQISPLLDQLFFTTFTPASDTRADICDGEEGISNLFVLNQTTGTSSLFSTLGVDGGISNPSIEIGSGNASGPLVFTSESIGSNEGVVIVQRQDGSLTPEFDANCDETVEDCNGAPPRAINNIQTIRSGWREILN